MKEKTKLKRSALAPGEGRAGAEYELDGLQAENGKAGTELELSRLPVKTWDWLNMNESVLKNEDAKRRKSARHKAPIAVRTAQSEEKESRLSFLCEAEENSAQNVELCVEENSSLTIWMEISSPKEAAGFLELAAVIKAGKNAKVRLIQVQLLGDGYRFLNNIKAECEEGANVELLQLFLGGAKTWAGFQGDLNKAKSGVSVQLGYWCRKEQSLDMNYVVLHNAKDTKSHILTKGVLADSAFKLFRGTIDFKRGASGSEGEEKEEVLILGEKAVNQSIPLILCGEEDVQGNHGASIGKPEEEVLFYLASRGMEKDDASWLLSLAKIDGLRRRIGDEEMEERVKDYLEVVRRNG